MTRRCAGRFVGRRIGKRIGKFIGRPVGQAMRRSASAVLLLAGLARVAGAADISVLSAGAVEPGIRLAFAAFEQPSGHRVALSGTTAPQILQRIETGASFDVVIAPPAVPDEIERAGRFVTCRAQRIVIGRVGVGVGVGVGVTVRAGVPLPDLTDAHALRRELLAADSLVFNRASTGRYFETVLKTLGVETAVLTKTTRYPDGAQTVPR